MAETGKEAMKVVRRRGISNLGAFHREAANKGLTYAEAQMKETCELIGKVSVPKGKLPDGRVYSKISDRIQERR